MSSVFFNKLSAAVNDAFGLLENLKKNNKYFGAVKVAIVLAIFFVFFTAINKQIDPDFGWHIKIGEWILENRQVPHADIFSNTMAGYQWVDHEWLMNAALFLASRNGLDGAVKIFFSLIALIPFAWWIWRAKSYAFLILIILGSLALLPFLAGARPAIISFLFFFLFFEILSRRYAEKNFRRTASFFLFMPLLLWFWANLHAGFAAGLFLFALFIFLHHARIFLSEKKLNLINVLYDASLMLVSALSTLINPYGLELWKEVLRIGTSFETQKYIMEWRPALSVPVPEIILFSAVFIFFAVQFFKKHDTIRLPVALVFFLLFMKSARQFFPFLIAALPVMENGLFLVEEKISQSQKTKPMAENTAATLRLAAFAAVFFIFGSAIFTSLSSETLAYPEKAAEFLSEESKSRNVVLLNDYGWGGYLVGRLPEIKVFIDGRMPHWVDDKGRSAMKDYAKIFYGDENTVRQTLAERKINTVLIKNAADHAKKYSKTVKYSASLIAPLLSDRAVLNWLEGKFGGAKNDLREILTKNGWQVIYQDETSVLLKKI